MKCRFYVWSFFIFFIISVNSHAGETVKIANGEWAPFYSESLKYYGSDSRIVTETFALEGIKVVYGFFPWKRSYEQSKTGEWDGTIGWPFSPEREKFHYYSKQPINAGEWVFFHRKGFSFNPNSIEDLKKVSIGITLGDWIMDGDDLFTQALRDNKLKYERNPQDANNFLMLSANRIDIFPQQLDVGLEQLKKLVINKKLTKEEASLITYHPKPFRKMPLYLLLSKKNERNKQLIETFDKGFIQLKESGRYDQITGDSRKKK